MHDPVLGPIDQIGYVVADLDRSIDASAAA